LREPIKKDSQRSKVMASARREGLVQKKKTVQDSIRPYISPQKRSSSMEIKRVGELRKKVSRYRGADKTEEFAKTEDVQDNERLVRRTSVAYWWNLQTR